MSAAALAIEMGCASSTELQQQMIMSAVLGWMEMSPWEYAQGGVLKACQDTPLHLFHWSVFEAHIQGFSESQDRFSEEQWPTSEISSVSIFNHVRSWFWLMFLLFPPFWAYAQLQNKSFLATPWISLISTKTQLFTEVTKNPPKSQPRWNIWPGKLRYFIAYMHYDRGRWKDCGAWVVYKLWRNLDFEGWHQDFEWFWSKSGLINLRWFIYIHPIMQHSMLHRDKLQKMWWCSFLTVYCWLFITRC